MTNVIIIQGGNLESYYEQTLDYLHARYHAYPSNLPQTSVDPDVVCELGYYERLGRKIAEEAEFDGEIPLGKLIL